MFVIPFCDCIFTLFIIIILNILIDIRRGIFGGCEMVVNVMMVLFYFLFGLISPFFVLSSHNVQGQMKYQRERMSHHSVMNQTLPLFAIGHDGPAGKEPGVILYMVVLIKMAVND